MADSRNSERRTRPSLEQNRAVPLQKNLLLVWSQNKISEEYQDIVLAYLDTLSPREAEQQIIAQIKAAHEGETYHHKITQCIYQRSRALANLQTLLTQQVAGERIETRQLSLICNELNSLRNSNLAVCQLLIQLHERYTRKQEGVGSHYKQTILNLDEENAFIKQSAINQYILFQEGFDPFFLYHYDSRGKHSVARSHQLVDKLFNLNISYACRLLKVRTKVLDILSCGVFVRQRKSRFHDDFATPVNPYLSIESILSERSKHLEDGPDLRKKTSVNFRTKTMSLQSAKQKHLLQNPMRKISANESTLNKRKQLFLPHYDDPSSEAVRSRPLLRQENPYPYQTIERESATLPVDEEQSDKLLPIRFRVPKKNPYRMQHEDSYKSSESNRKVPKELNEDPNGRSFKNAIMKLRPLEKSKTDMGVGGDDEVDNLEQYRLLNNMRKERDNRITIKPNLIKESSEVNRSKEASPEPKLQKSPLKATLQKQNTVVAQSPSKREIKMRPGKYSFSELFKYLKTLTISEQVRKITIDSQQWQQSLLKCQSYFCEFLINNEVMAVSLVIVMPEGDYLIKLWAPLENCTQETSLSLFQKYLEYIERMSSVLEIYYTGNEIKEIKATEFTLKKARLYSRRRTSPFVKKKQEFTPFVSIKCSNIVIPQANLAADVLYSEQIEPFTQENSFVSRPIACIDKDKINQNLQIVVKISEDIADIKALNSLLADEGFDTYEVTSLKIDRISVLRIAVDSCFKGFFIAGQGYFKFAGEQVYRDENSLICRVNCAKFNMRLFFGRGFSKSGRFVSCLKKESKKACNFSLKMFNKQLYGRLPVADSREGCYGNWELTFWWQDELQGRVKHAMTNGECFGPESFMVGVEVEKELVYCFQVKQQDFLF